MNTKTLSEIAEVEKVIVRNKEALLKVAEAIERYPDKFDMGEIKIPDPNNCGTAGCIAGFAAMLYPEATEPHYDYVSDRIWSFHEKTLAKILGITDDECVHLFWQTKAKNGSYIGFEKITASMAAATVRRFAETGEIYFDLKEGNEQ